MQLPLLNSLVGVYVKTITLLIMASGYLNAMQPSGQIIRADHDHIQNAVVEHILLFSKEDKDSDKTLTRKGMLIRYPKAKATIVICHGFMCDKHDVGFLRKLFPRLQFNILTFDFRAHGEDSANQYCTFGHDEAYDVIAAANFVRQHQELQGLPVYVYGFSMGAVSAIQAQEIQPNLFDALMLDCPFASSENVVKRALSTMKISIFGYEFDMPGRGLLERYAFHPYVQSLLKVALKTVANMDSKNIAINIKPIHPIESIKKITAPCFFVHCKNDEKIPMEDVMALYEAAGGYKRLWITNGRRHYDSFFYNPETYIARIREFLKAVNSNTLPELQHEMIIEN